MCRSSGLADGERRQQLVVVLAVLGPDPAVAVEFLRTLPCALKSPAPAVIPTSVTM